jgi:peptide/nickel transport system ATP-binding protein
MTGTPILSINRVTVAFKEGDQKRPAANDVSFSVNKGEAYGLVGESGSGKSTMLRAIVGLLPQFTGKIEINGANVRAQDAKTQARIRQMVFQDPYGSLHPRRTVDQTLREAVTIHGIDNADERIARTLNDVGIAAAMRHRYPHQLSGGQRQRIAIARTIILDPPLLLLDEPTSALDVSVQAEILNLLKDLRRDRNLTFVMVSHDLSVVAYMCDRIGVMKDGALIEEASKEAFLKKDVHEPYTQELLSAFDA